MLSLSHAGSPDVLIHGITRSSWIGGEQFVTWLSPMYLFSNLCKVPCHPIHHEAYCYNDCCLCLEPCKIYSGTTVIVYVQSLFSRLPSLLLIGVQYLKSDLTLLGVRLCKTIGLFPLCSITCKGDMALHQPQLFCWEFHHISFYLWAVILFTVSVT